MKFITQKLEASPTLARVAPFAIFLGLTFCQGQFGEASRYWFYLAKTLAGVWMLWVVRPFIPEMKWAWSWEAPAVGIAVFVIWVGLDGLYPSLDDLLKLACPILEPLGFKEWCLKAPSPKPEWNPHLAFGVNSGLAWMFMAVRFLGSAWVVPPLEEVFYRSFLYRYVARPDFQQVPLGHFSWAPFLITAAIFGFGHEQWLAGILCAFAYQGLVCRRKRLGDAMTAHAITNLLLGLWVVGKEAWHFW